MLRKLLHDDVNKMLLKGFIQQRYYNMTISGAILRAKAEEFGRKLNDELTCKEGWIDRSGYVIMFAVEKLLVNQY